MKIFLPISFAVAALSVAGQAFPVDSSHDEIVVTAKGNQSLYDVLPTSHVITREDIEAAQVKDLPAMLDRLSGISVRDSGGRGSVTGVFLRGAQTSRVIVLIDGVRVGSATLGAATLNSYPLEAIERIEVVKGPLSGIYGADALGGVIQIFTKKNGEGLGSARVSVGNDNLKEFGLALNGGNDKHSFRLSADIEDTDGIDRTSLTVNGAGDDDSFEEKAFSFAGKTIISDSVSAQISVLYTDNTSEFDDTFGGVSNGLLTDTKTLNTALNISAQLNQSVQLTTLLGTNKDESVTPTPSAFPSNITTNRDSLATELSIDLGTSSNVTIGFDYYDEDIETADITSTTDRDNKGVFALLQSNKGQFGFVGNLRYDDNSAYGSNTNGSVALNYDINQNTRAVLSYGTAFVAPSFNFLYFPFFGNPDLTPEESTSWELSLLGNTNNIDWRISAFQTDIDDLHSFDPNTFTAINIGESELKGLEFELKTDLFNWTVSTSLDLLSAENKVTGKELDDRAERTLKITASRTFDVYDIRIDLKAEDGRFDNNGTELSGYGLFDISGVYRFNQKLSLSANIDNLFDKDYTVNLLGATNRYNTEGRQAKLTLNYNF